MGRSYMLCCFQRIFLWDLDETIIIFHSLLTGTYAQKFGKVRFWSQVRSLSLKAAEIIRVLVLVLFRTRPPC